MGAPLPEISPGQRWLLETIYRAYRDTRDWPTVAFVEDELDEAGYDFRRELGSMPSDFVWPGAGPPGAAVYQRNEPIAIRVRGLRYCDDSDADLKAFIVALHWLVEQRSRARARSPQEAPDPDYRASDIIS